MPMQGLQPQSPQARRWRQLRRDLLGHTFRRDTASALGISLRVIDKYETLEDTTAVPTLYRLALIGAAVVRGKRPSRKLVAAVMGDGEQLSIDQYK